MQFLPKRGQGQLLLHHYQSKRSLNREYRTIQPLNDHCLPMHVQFQKPNHQMSLTLLDSTQKGVKQWNHSLYRDRCPCQQHSHDQSLKWWNVKSKQILELFRIQIHDVRLSH
jgi:hypothetical protein